MKHGVKYLGRARIDGDWTEEGILTVGYVPTAGLPYIVFRSSTLEGNRIMFFKENIHIIKEL